MSQSTDSLLRQIQNGDETAIEPLLSRHRGRLRKMIRIRLHPKLRKRVDESDILQEALFNASQRMGDFFMKSKQPFFLWLRAVTSQVILSSHRFHLDAQKRTAKLDYVDIPGDDSLSLSMAQIIVSNDRSPGSIAELRDLQEQVRTVLESMTENDREILCMRHFEGMSNVEVAAALEISTSNASTRYIRALSKLRHLMKDVPGFF